MKKRTIAVLLTMAMAVTMMAGCGSSSAAANTDSDAASQDQASDWDSSNDISIVSREDGSGTRGAFIELFGVEEKNAAGEKIDNTTDEAIITNSTDVMLTTVSGDEYSIG